MSRSANQNSRSRLYSFAPWSVHAYTAMGAVAGLLTLKFAADHSFRAAFVAMAVATVIDSSDGPLARYLDIKRRLPQFDGALLDNVIDYLNYVITPAFLMLSAGLLPQGAPGLAVAAVVVLSSAYGFCRAEAKTQDHYFLGFPSYWNLVAFYLYCFGLGAIPNSAILLGFAAMVFTPLKFIYPNRTRALRPLTLVLAMIWAGLVIAILADFPKPSQLLVWLSFGFIGYYLVMSFAMNAWMFCRRRTNEQRVV